MGFGKLCWIHFWANCKDRTNILGRDWGQVWPYLGPVSVSGGGYRSASCPPWPSKRNRINSKTKHGVVFIDGSCFPRPRKDLQAACSAYCVGRLQYVQSLPGPDQSSQRAELFALLLVLQHFSGDVGVACDCQNVVSGFLYLKSGHFRSSLVEGLDNRDVWAAIAFAALHFDGVINVFKVKAHVVDSGSIDQPPHLSAGNRRVDELARNHAYERFSSNFFEFDAYVSRALDLQTRMISTLASRKFSGFPSMDDLPQQASCFKVCKCPLRPEVGVSLHPGVFVLPCHL